MIVTTPLDCASVAAVPLVPLESLPEPSKPPPKEGVEPFPKDGALPFPNEGAEPSLEPEDPEEPLKPPNVPPDCALVVLGDSRAVAPSAPAPAPTPTRRAAAAPKAST